MPHTDILIEDAKNHLQTWGSQSPTFLLCNGALTAQLTMLPEKTNYLTNGIDGQKRLAQGPELASYRGLSIIHSRKFSMDTGTTPRDLFRRRVRVAEYYRIPWDPANVSRSYEFYDQSRDTMFRLTWDQLCEMAQLPAGAGSDHHDGDHPGMENNSWVIRAGPDTPTDFTYHDWNGKDDLGTQPLRMVPNNPDQYHATKTIAGGYKFEGLDAFFERLGIGKSIRQQQSSLHWPRTIYNTSGDKHKKRTLDQLSEEVGDKTKGAKSTRYIRSKLSEDARNHHRQSETWSGGLFNDPLVVSDEGRGDVICNWQGLLNVENLLQEATNYWMVINAFNKLHTKLNLAAWEDQLVKGQTQPCCAKEQASFKNEAVIKFAKHFKKENDAGVLAHLSNGVAATCTDFAEARYEQCWAILDIGREMTSYIDNYDTDTFTPETRLQHMMMDSKFTVLDYQKIAAKAMKAYLDILIAWRLRCFGDAMLSMFEHGANNLRTKHGNPAGHSHFSALEKGLKTACIAHYCRAEAMMDQKGGTVLMLQEMTNNTETACMITNIINSALPCCIMQPNMHITRCTPLRSADHEESASSLHPDTWILQQLAGMMPLTGDTAATLLKHANSSDQGSNYLKQEYVKFLCGSGSTTVSHNNSNVWDSFLMHWFMSEFHPSAQVRAAATKKSGNMQTLGAHKVEELMMAMADAIENNRTVDTAIQKKMDHLAPGMYDGKSTSSYFSVATAATNYHCIQKWNSNTNLHCQSVKWKDMPVDATQDHLYFNSRQPCGVTDIDNSPNNRSKAFKKAGRQYMMSGMALIEDKDDVFDLDDSVKYYDAHDKRNPVKTVQSSDHEVELCHPWTNFIPGGIEAISSLGFPIDLQYRSTECDPVQAMATHVPHLYDASDSDMRRMASSSAHFCRQYSQEAMRHVLMILFTRFFKPSQRFMFNGAGIPIRKDVNSNKYALAGCHLSHGPELPYVVNGGPGGVGGAQDIVILRPNIEHEMLGIVMGRGGTQELGATFWGQV